MYEFDNTAKVSMRCEISFVDLARLCGMYETRHEKNLTLCFVLSRIRGASERTRVIVEKKEVKDALGVNGTSESLLSCRAR